MVAYKGVGRRLSCVVCIIGHNGFTVATALLGSIVGALAVGKPTDTFGRRGVLFGLAILFLAASVGCALAWSLEAFIVFRFIGGLAVGGASVVAPVYIAELSPAAYRGRLVTITQLNIVLGILLAYLSNYLIGRMDQGEHEARWMFGVMAIRPSSFSSCSFSRRRVLDG
jgi:MFS family permease